MEEETKETAKRILRGALKSTKVLLMPIMVIVIIVVVILSASVYFITVDDGTYKEGDWSSTPYAASTYVNNVTINTDGTLASGTTAQELWDKMLENGSRVDEYLDSPEELARLMRAEIVTQYPDTRSNPDEEINWDEIIKNGDTLQGIIKFKRADNDGNTTTMTYADPVTFQGYIDEYNSSGSETARQNALSHFTLKKGVASTSTGNGGAVAAGEGVMTDVSQAIIDATNVVPWPNAMWCARWVDNVYDKAGVTACRHWSAYESYKHHCISTDMSAIPVGAAIYGTGCDSAGYGHIGIYLGGGKVIDSINTGIQVTTLDKWLTQQKDTIEGKTGWLGWGWEDNNRIRGTTEDPNVTQSDGSKEEDNEKEDEDVPKDDNGNEGKAVETPVNGDGYSIEYTSSAGITYKLFKQIKGTYADNPYWGNTIYWAGCGPTSVAILASGIKNSDYTPANIAAEMDEKYGLTSYATLKSEIEPLGMTAEVTQNPTAQNIQDALKNGKVMLVSVNSSTIFTGSSHIMAVVDINEQGQVYICNPSSDTINGWYDVSELMKGCDYIITTDAGAAGVAKSDNDSNYTAVVATWKQTDTTITTDDESRKGEEVSTTEYRMSTSDINYEEMVDPYTMPFDLLWALLVVGESKNFVFDLADLVYNSDLEITVYDNLTTNTDVDNWTYKIRTRADVTDNIVATCQSESGSGGTSATETYNHTHDPWGEDVSHTWTKTVVTKTNTINIALTRANVWIVDYQNNYTYVAPSTTTTTDTKTEADGEYGAEPSSTGTEHTCNDLNVRKESVAQRAESDYAASHEDEEVPEAEISETISVNYFTKQINKVDNITHTVETQKYVEGTPTLKEKTDPKSTEPNFVTIFNKKKYKNNKSNIKSASSWLFEILEINDSTADMVDLIKYLLYKATGVNYGVTEFDFSIFYPGSLTSVGAGDYIVDTTKSGDDIVITDIETLKTAFAGSGGAGSSNLVQYADAFLEFQETYHVNAVFAAAVTTIECGAGTNLQIGGNNWFSISDGNGGWRQYDSPRGAIEDFYKLIANGSYYFQAGKYTVKEIGNVYCVDADAPGGWIDNVITYMTNMFNAAGISTSSEATTDIGEKVVEAAKSKIGCAYVHGAAGPDTFDCSGLTMWCYQQVGISIPHNDTAQKNAAKKVVPVSEARVGDILWNSGHVGIYIGDGKFIHAPHPGAAVGIQSVSSYGSFTNALQMY